MKNKKIFKSILIIIIIILMNHVYCNYFTVSMLLGDYYNVNFENSPAVETSRIPDTLKLKSGNYFYSNFYGEGKFEVKHSLTGTKINVRYNSGTANFEKSVTRNWFEKPKIIMFRDLNHYYQKFN